MAQSNSKTKTTLTFSVLLGALAFNLSSLPGAKVVRQPAQTLSFSSTSGEAGCDLDEQLQSGDSAGCTVTRTENGQKIQAKIKVNLVKVHRTKRDQTDLSKFIEEDTQKWHVEVDTETECKEGCADGVIRRDPVHKDLEFGDLRLVGSTAMDLFDSEAKDLAEAASKEKALNRKKENCDVDADGHELDSSKDILNCRIGKLKEMDKDKAATYFDENIQADLEAMAISDDPKERRLAAQLMASNSPLGKLRNAYIGQSLKDLNQFGAYSDAARTLQAQINNPLADSNQRSQALQSLRGLQNTWGQYFAQQGRQLANLQPRGFESIDFGGSLANDAASYQQNLDNNFAAIAAQHNLAINGVQSNGVLPENSAALTAIGTGRNMYGTPTTSIPGAINNTGLVRPNSTTPGAVAIPQTGAAGLSARRLGQPVR